MANTLTNLAADIYVAAEKVGRQLVGAVPSVMLNAGTEGAALNQTVRSFTTSEPTLNTSYSPAMTIPEGDAQTVGNDSITIGQVANVQIPWSGEEIKFVDAGNGYETILGHQIQRAMSKITNAIEAHTCDIIRLASTRAYGTAGTTPFGSNFNDVAEVRQILVDNGMPDDGEATLLINSAAGTKLRNLAQLQKANENGSDQLLRRGTLLDLQGFMMKESAGVKAVTKGTGTSYQLNGALAVGDTTVTVDTGSGTILAGGVVTISNYKYVVKTALSGGSFTIQAPGIREVVADNTAITVNNNHTANVGFHRSAVELVVRPPAQPYGGDAAVDRITVQDPFSGLVYEFAVYKGYGKAMMDVTAFYQAKVWNPSFVATLLG